MRVTAGSGIFAILVCIILFEFSSLGAYLARAAEPVPAAECAGQALCQ